MTNITNYWFKCVYNCPRCISSIVNNKTCIVENNERKMIFEDINEWGIYVSGDKLVDSILNCKRRLDAYALLLIRKCEVQVAQHTLCSARHSEPILENV